VLLDETLTLSPLRVKPLTEAAYDSFEQQVLAASHPGQFAAARVDVPGTHQPLILVSLYGVWHTPWSGNGAEASLHRAISDLTPVLLSERRIVLAGDLNLFRNTGNVGQRRFDTVFDRLGAYSMALAGPFRSPDGPPLEGCTCGQGDNCDHVETFRIFRENAKPYQDDYVFASEAVTVASCFVVADPDIRDKGLSDHWPVVADVDLD
jgi:hypothetical protein